MILGLLLALACFQESDAHRVGHCGTSFSERHPLSEVKELARRQALAFAYRCMYNTCMKAVPYGVRELQARIGRALRIVERGGTILVTSRGRPVAMVVPPETRMPGESEEDWILRRLAAEGRLIPG